MNKVTYMYEAPHKYRKEQGPKMPSCCTKMSENNMRPTKVYLLYCVRGVGGAKIAHSCIFDPVRVFLCNIVHHWPLLQNKCLLFSKTNIINSTESRQWWNVFVQERTPVLISSNVNYIFSSFQRCQALGSFKEIKNWCFFFRLKNRIFYKFVAVYFANTYAWKTLIKGLWLNIFQWFLSIIFLFIENALIMI